MIVTWIAIQAQPVPWEERRVDVAYVACGERADELKVVRAEGAPNTPAIDRLIDSLDRTISIRKGASRPDPSLSWLRRAIPDQGTSIRLSSPTRTESESFEAELSRLAARLPLS